MTAEMPPESLAAIMEATWPPAVTHTAGPWRIRDGQQGGQRVSATTAEAAWRPADIALAEAEMAALHQSPLFLIRETDAALDAELARQGYHVHDPVVAYAIPSAALAPPDPMAAFAHWPPLAIATEIWADGGIGPARLAVMQRATGPKTAILSRQNDRPTGTAFVAIHQNTAMLHALEVAPQHRRQGSANIILRAAAAWAQDQGATTLSLVVTKANAPACALYASLGMEVVGNYHYRVK